LVDRRRRGVSTAERAPAILPLAMLVHGGRTDSLWRMTEDNVLAALQSVDVQINNSG
jgi:hypothetical protein